MLSFAKPWRTPLPPRLRLRRGPVIIFLRPTVPFVRIVRIASSSASSGGRAHRFAPGLDPSPPAFVDSSRPLRPRYAREALRLRRPVRSGQDRLVDRATLSWDDEPVRISVWQTVDG